MTFPLIYNSLLHLMALPTLGKMGLEMVRTGKYRGNFLPRLGAGFPKIEKGSKKLIWIHAVSMGETKAVAPLVRKLKNSDTVIVLSTVTETGHREGKKVAPEADYHVYLPFDLPYLIRPIIKRVKPDVVLLTETDFWFNFQDAAQKAGAKLILVNGKLSERSLSRYQNFPLFSKQLIDSFDRLLVQGDLYANRFRKIGISPSKIKITGNIKLDGVMEEETLFDREKLQLSGPLLTLGSTHDPEERLWIEALKRIWKRIPDLKVFIVPRHPERFETVARLLASENIPFHAFSKQPYFGEAKVVLVDAMGLLRQCYKISTLAFVGGSLAKIGGHNILEPAYYGVPVLYGPHMHQQPDLLDLMNRYEAGVCVREDLVQKTVELLLNEDTRRQMGERGKLLVKESQGALEETLQEILKA